MAERRWFYEMLAEEFGPVTETGIEQLVADGMLSASDRVRPSESADWITVADFPAAVIAMSQEQQDDRHSDLDIDSFSFESSPVAAADELDIDSFNLIGDSDSPQPVVTNPHRPVEPVDDEDDFEPTFFVQSLGQVLGPLTQDELVEMACAGSLSRGDEIREGEDSRWIGVEAIPGLGAEILRQEATLPQSQSQSATAAEPTKKNETAAVRKRPSTSKAKSKRRKRKKKAKTDEFLQEIFAEVFTDDGKVREDRIAAAAAAPPVPTVAPAAMPADVAAQMSTGSSTAPGMSAAASSPAAFTRPTPSRAPKKASKSSSGFEMPEPKVLGMIGGGVAVLLILVGGFMGIIPLPGFGVNPESFFNEFAAEYPKMKAASAEEWKEFRMENSSTARGIARSLATTVATDPEARRMQRVALLVTKLVNIAQTDAEKHAETFTEFKEMLAGE